MNSLNLLVLPKQAGIILRIKYVLSFCSIEVEGLVMKSIGEYEIVICCILKFIENYPLLLP